MNQDIVEWLACPKDGHYPLKMRARVPVGDKVDEGELVCPSCGREFHIVAGIPKLLFLDQDQLSRIKQQEVEARDLEYRQVKKKELEVDRLREFDAIRSSVADGRGLLGLDAGCGIGKMTPALQAMSRVVGLDFSWEGLLKFQFPKSPTVDLIQGDVSRMPFRDALFDLSISSQVLEHLPSEGLRSAFVAELARTLKTEGQLCITAYNWNGDRREAGEPKEGFHSSGIFFHSYDAEEFRVELEKYFEIQAIWGVEVYFPKTYRLVKALGKNNIYWDRFWRTKRLSLNHSKLLLGICQRRS